MRGGPRRRRGVGLGLGRGLGLALARKHVVAGLGILVGAEIVYGDDHDGEAEVTHGASHQLELSPPLEFLELTLELQNRLSLLVGSRLGGGVRCLGLVDAFLSTLQLNGDGLDPGVLTRLHSGVEFMLHDVKRTLRREDLEHLLAQRLEVSKHAEVTALDLLHELEALVLFTHVCTNLLQRAELPARPTTLKG